MSKPLKTPAPLSVRLTQAERDVLLIRAGGQTLSAYVKAVLFDGPQPMPRGGGVTLANRTLLAHLLATLGQVSSLRTWRNSQARRRRAIFLPMRKPLSA